MAVSKYRTKNGLRFKAEIFDSGVRIDSRGGFKTRLEAMQWEKNYHQNALEPKPNVLELWQAVTKYLLDIEDRLKPNTRSYKKTCLNRFIEYAGKNTPLREIERATIKDFLKSIKKKLSAKSANKHQTELSALWTWTLEEGLAQANPAKLIEPFPTTKSVKYVPPKIHIKKVLERATQFESDFILSLLHTAGRISELRELAWEDVDFERNVLRLWTSKRKGGDRESRTLAISPTMQGILTRLSENRTGGEIYVFTNPLTGAGYSRQSREIKYLFKRVCARAEVPMFTAHSLRHYVATHFNDPRRAQKILGHENIRTTEIYLHELGADVGAAAIFEDITNEITNGNSKEEKKGFVQ